jgi:hypothetical protein
MISQPPATLCSRVDVDSATKRAILVRERLASSCCTGRRA